MLELTHNHATAEPPPPARLPASAVAPRRVRVIHFCPWAGRLQDGADFLRTLPQLDLRPRVSDPTDAALLVKARLDCDWHGENVRALGAMDREGLAFLPVQTVGVIGLLDLVTAPVPADEERWLVIGGQHPQKFANVAAQVFARCARQGIRVLYYAFDEASRAMPCFPAIAPHLDVLIHDESPLAPAALRPDCVTVHRSWVANLVPFAAPFCAEPEEKIVFLGSQLGLTPHRRRQIDFLQKKFRDRFFALCDHSLPVNARATLAARAKVSVCPEGRMFATPAMAATHTDRPFWSGCLGLVPVSEDSRAGGRLEALHRAGLIERYAHGDLAALSAACERALAAPPAERRRIYDHFNRYETIGAVVSAALSSTRLIPSTS